VAVEKNVLCFDICDNGIGGNIKEWTPGKGLNNIKNRVDELKGTVDWNPSEQSGCCVFLQLPIQ
jgi:signal transduction histidine kinase